MALRSQIAKLKIRQYLQRAKLMLTKFPAKQYLPGYTDPLIVVLLPIMVLPILFNTCANSLAL